MNRFHHVILSLLFVLFSSFAIASPSPQRMEPAKSSVTAADLAASPLARLAQAIEEGDAETAAAFVRFPLERQAPIPPIANAREFIDYFPTLFDEAFRDQMREGDFAEDWHEAGCRGATYNYGDIWVDGTLDEGGLVSAVDYQSEAEKRLREALVEEERQTLPPPLADTCDPVLCFRTDDGEFVGRVDRLESDTFRIALFPGPARTGRRLPRHDSQPDAVFQASDVPEGNGGNHVYLDRGGQYALMVSVIGTEAPELDLLERASWAEAFGTSRRAHSCPWRDLLEPPSDSDGAADASHSPTDAIRSVLDDFGITYREKPFRNTTVFSYSFAVNPESPRFSCDILARDGAPFVVARARLSERIPADRRRDVAQCLLDLNDHRAAGSYRLDWRKRAVFFEFAFPAASFSADDPVSGLLLVGGPTLWLDEERPLVLAAAGLLPADGESGAEESSPTAEVADSSTAAEGAPGEIPDGDDDGDEAHPWIAPFVQKALERQGSLPTITRDDEKTTFQFPTILRGPSLFSRVTVSLSAMENWVYLLLSPDVRVPDALRAPVAEWAMRVTVPSGPAAFAWLDEADDIPRIAAKTACPAQAFAADPDRCLLRMLQDAAQPFQSHSRSFAAVLSGLCSPAKALAATGETLPSP